MNFLYSFLILFSFALNAAETDVITVKAKRSLNLSSSVFFNTNEINKHQSFEDLIKSQSDLFFLRSGGLGQNASLFIRGNDSANIMVIIDGIVMNDPSNPNGQFDFGKLEIQNMSKVEILKGPQTLLYGPNASGGVLLITSKDSRRDLRTLSLKAGSFNTYQSALNIVKSSEKAHLSLGGNYLFSQGLSAAKDLDKPTNDKDHSRQVNSYFLTSYKLNEAHSLKFNHLFTQDKTDIDKGAGKDDPNDYQRQNQHSFLIAHQLEKENFTSDLNYSLVKIKRSLFIEEDDIDTQNSIYVNEVTAHKLSLNLLHSGKKTFSHQAKLDHNIEHDKAKHYARTSSIVYSQFLDLSSFLLSYGARIDSHNRYQEETTYQIGLEKKFEKLQVKINHATGIKAPTLSQLFDTYFGNKDLVPEKNMTTDLNFDYFLNSSLGLNLSLFYSSIKDRLTYDPATYISINQGEASILGTEFKTSLKATDHLTFIFSNTYLKTEDKSTRQNLLRRPHLNSRFKTEYELEKMLISLEGSYISKRDDLDKNMQRINMPSYVLLDAAWGYQVSTTLKTHLKVNNLLDKNYEALSGFNSPKRSYSFEMNYLF